MEFKKINILDCAKPKVYHDRYGWVERQVQIYIVGKVKYPGESVAREKRISFNLLYVKSSNGQLKKLSELQLTLRKLVEYDYNEVYVDSQSYSYSIGSNCIRIEEAEPRFVWRDKEIQDFSEIIVYDLDYNERLLHLYEIREGLRVQRKEKDKFEKDKFGSHGTYIIKKCFEQPNRDNYLCEIEPLEADENKASSVVVKCDDYVLFTVPYETYPAPVNELDTFNHPLCEPALAPFAERKDSWAKTDTNIYWHSIPDASGYVISLYKLRITEKVSEIKEKLYLLEKYSVDRNKNWISLHNLIGSGYIVMIEAEDRSGTVIARSRGIDIDNAQLKWF